MKSIIWFDGSEFIAGSIEDYSYALNDQSISILNGYEFDSLEKAQNTAGVLNKSNVKKAARDLKNGQQI
ncbi:MAG: hypothetical protein RIC35_18745 [Marinoscillum sp.]